MSMRCFGRGSFTAGIVVDEFSERQGSARRRSPHVQLRINVARVFNLE